MWERTLIEEINEMEDCHFYAFSQGNNLLYIGMTWDQTIQKEVKKTLYLYDAKKKELIIWLGYIVDIDYKRLTKNIVKDVEALLIRYHEPNWNVSNVKNYTGRDKLIVINDMFPLLEKYLRVERDHIYTTKP